MRPCGTAEAVNRSATHTMSKPNREVTGAILDRIVVVGTSCSGKTTLARKLCAILGGSEIELDALHWGPNWTPRIAEEFHAALRRAVQADRWVADGNYGTVRDILWPRATAVVWLNYGFPTVFGRALYRTVRRSITKEPLYSGNRESFRNSFFSRESILLWVLQTYRRNRRRYRQLQVTNSHPHLRWIELRSPREADAFLASVSDAGRSRW